MNAECQTKINNGAMEGAAVDQSDGKGIFLLPPGWTKVNVNENGGDRISVAASDRPGGGQCLYVKTQGGGAYQTVAPLKKDTTYLVSAWVKRVSGTIDLTAYSHAWGPSVMKRQDSSSNGWTRITATLHTIDGGAHIYLISSPRAEYYIDDVEIAQAPVQVSSPVTMPYDFSGNWSYKVKLDVSEGESVPSSVVVQAVNITGKVLSEPKTVTLKAGKSASAVVSMSIDTLDVFSVEVMDPKTGAILGGSALTNTAEYPIIINYPHKNSLYSSLDYSYPLKIRLFNGTAEAMKKLKAQVSIINSDIKVVKQLSGTLKVDALVVPLDGNRMEPGNYLLKVLVTDKNDKVLHDTTKPLRILPKADNEVVMDANGDTLVGGKKFFPIGLYWVLADPAGWKPGPARKTEDMLELRRAGFNTIHTYAFEHNDSNDTDDNAVAYLDMAQELGFKVMMGLRRDWCQGDTLNREAIETRVNRLKTHPALLCWTIWDEPDFHIGNVPKVQAIYDIVDRLDPYHPAMPVFMQSGGRPFRNAADANLTDYYPGAGNAGYVPGVLERAKLAIPDKPLWYAAQAYNRPSEQDMRLFWQYALAADVKAIFWYSYGGDGKDWDSIRNTPELYADVKKVVRELADKVGEK